MLAAINKIFPVRPQEGELSSLLGQMWTGHPLVTADQYCRSIQEPQRSWVLQQRHYTSLSILDGPLFP